MNGINSNKVQTDAIAVRHEDRTAKKQVLQKSHLGDRRHQRGASFVSQTISCSDVSRQVLRSVHGVALTAKGEQPQRRQMRQERSENFDAWRSNLVPCRFCYRLSRMSLMAQQFKRQNSMILSISGVAAAHSPGAARSTRAEIASSAPMPPRLHCQ